MQPMENCLTKFIEAALPMVERRAKCSSGKAADWDETTWFGSQGWQLKRHGGKLEDKLPWSSLTRSSGPTPPA